MNSFRRRFFVLLVCVLALTLVMSAVPASAATVLSNAGSPASNSHNVALGGTIYASGFTVPAGPDYQLNSATLSLARWINIGASATANLYSDSSGSPGSLVVSLGSASPSSTSFGNYTFTGSTTLNAGSTYWLVVTGTNLKIRRATAVPTGVFTDAGTRFNPLTIGWFNLNQPFVLTVDADPMVTVSSITRASANPTGAASVGLERHLQRQHIRPHFGQLCAGSHGRDRR